MGNELPMTRLSLVQALQNGLRWEEFVTIYGLAIGRWVRRWAPPWLPAEELAQDALVHIWRNLSRFDRGRGAFRSFLCVCARSAALNAARRALRKYGGVGQERGQQLLAQLEARQQSGEAEPELEDQLDAAEPLGKAVQRVKKAVGDTRWRAFVLRRVEGESAEAIARQLQMPVARVYKWVHGVGKMLQEALSDLSRAEEPAHEHESPAR